MSELPLSSKYRVRAGDPVDDAERNDLAARLANEFTAGRLAQDDYLAKLDVVYRAATLGELADIALALPPRATHDVPAIAQQTSGVPGTVNQAKGVATNTVLAVAGVGLFALIAIVLLVFLAF